MLVLKHHLCSNMIDLHLCGLISGNLPISMVTKSLLPMEIELVQTTFSDACFDGGAIKQVVTVYFYCSMMSLCVSSFIDNHPSCESANQLCCDAIEIILYKSISIICILSHVVREWSHLRFDIKSTLWTSYVLHARKRKLKQWWSTIQHKKQLFLISNHEDKKHHDIRYRWKFRSCLETGITMWWC